MSARRVLSHNKRGLSALCALLLALGTALTALGYSNTTGSGFGLASMGALNAPTAVSAIAAGSTVSVAWTPSSGGVPPEGYVVERYAGTTPSPACGTSPTSPTTATAAGCSDLGVSSGTYTYSVTAVYESWAAPSTASSPVTVTLPATRLRVTAPPQPTTDEPPTPTVKPPATKLVFGVSPGSVSADGVLSPAPRVSVVDAGGNVVSGDGSAVVLSLTSGTPLVGGPGSLTGCSASELRGVVTFAGCRVTTSGTGYELHASAVGLTGAESGGFDVAPGAAAKLVFAVSPGGASGGVAFSSEPVVTVEDQFGNTVTGDGSTVALAITSGTPASGAPGTLSGCSQAEAAGVVTFAGCAIDTAGGGYELHATDGSLAAADSSPFSVTPGDAAQLVFGVSPGSVSADGVLSPAPRVSVVDAGGNVVSGDGSAVVLSLTSGTPLVGGPGSLTGCSASELRGVVTFAGCRVTTSGTGYELHASAVGLTGAESGGFDVAPGAAAKLVFAVSPGGASGGVAFSSEPVVTVEDQFGNTVTGDGSTVALAITSGTPASGAPGTLSGCSQAEAAGVVTFAGCAIDTAGGGYELHATDGSLAAADSSPFSVTPGDAAQLVFGVSPGSVSADGVLSPAPRVSVVDAGGNVVSGDGSAVVLSLTSGTPLVGGPGSLTGCSASELRGVVTFAGCRVTTSGTGYELHASAVGLTGAESGGFDVAPGAAAKLVFAVSPGGASGGVAFSSEPVVTVEDQFGNTVTGDGSTVALAITSGTPASGAPGTLSGCSQAEAAGVVTFAGCAIDTAGGGYELHATDGSLAAADSSPFSVTPGDAVELVFMTRSANTSASQRSRSISV